MRVQNTMASTSTHMIVSIIGHPPRNGATSLRASAMVLWYPATRYSRFDLFTEPAMRLTRTLEAHSSRRVYNCERYYPISPKMAQHAYRTSWAIFAPASALDFRVWNCNKSPHKLRELPERSIRLRETAGGWAEGCSTLLQSTLPSHLGQVEPISAGDRTGVTSCVIIVCDSKTGTLS